MLSRRSFLSRLTGAYVAAVSWPSWPSEASTFRPVAAADLGGLFRDIYEPAIVDALNHRFPLTSLFDN